MQTNQRLKAQQLLFTAVAAGVLLSFPFLSVANAPQRVCGVPVLFAYVFGVWAALIGLTAWLVERHYRRTPGDDDDE